ncbi:AAA family ATPase [Nonomuraea sp. NPDC026600]|uniref:AAA family ATPase n=1 Tax=Nonomuraea sp. NPDC026600 TaxID=3155363 RepID=UPI0033E5CDBC
MHDDDHRTPQRGRVVVGLEGPCFAGKTTLAGALADRFGATIAPEYADVTALPPFPPADEASVTAALEHFLMVEHSRADRAAGAVVVCDRSPLTLIAFEHAMAALAVPRDPIHAIALFTQAAERGGILVPDGYVHLTITPEQVAARQQWRGPVAAHLAHPGVQALMREAYEFYLRQVPPQRCLFLDGGQPLAEVVQATSAFLDGLAVTTAPPPPSWRCLLPLVTTTTGGQQ